MLAISLLIALMLDRLIPALRRLRTGDRFDAYIGWMLKQGFIKTVPRRLLPYLLILPIIFAVGLIDRLLPTSAVFELGFGLLIALLCLQPRVLNEEVDEEIAALASSESTPDLNLDRLFGRANRALYCVIFWMVVAGPVWVLTYRLLETLMRMEGLPERQHWLDDLVRIVSWIEWLPALISSYLFLLCGNFEAGIKSGREIPLLDKNIADLNEMRLAKIGMAVLQTGTAESESSKVDALKRGRGMLLRTLVVWLALAGLIDYWI